MTNKELVNTYLEHQGFKKIEGGDDDFSPLLPFLMLDLMYQMWSKTIKPINCKFEMKRYKKAWIENYNAFNTQFFRCFTQEQQDAIIEKMDDFEEYVQNNLMIAKVQLMNCLSFETFERQEVLATCLLCSILAQASHIIWGRVYKDARQRDTENLYIRGIETNINGFMNLYYGKGKPHVKPDESKPVSDAVDALCKKTISWLSK